ncbi:MAG: N-acetylmuramoyl-L-alanine amidase [Acidobacteriales bacterium]|nr:N-acetylmuramoyl-L-alanine amidase [Terriglobales bacterium]
MRAPTIRRGFFRRHGQRFSRLLLRWAVTVTVASGGCAFYAITHDSPASLASANNGAGHAVRSEWLARPAIKKKPRIVLDAGHGGCDLGSMGANGLLEKDLSLDLVRRVARLLEEEGRYDVIFTRAADSYVPLAWRAQAANLLSADVFVSIHANASRSVLATGPETYYSATFASERAKVQGAAPSDGLVLPDNRRRTAHSRLLAELIQDQLKTVARSDGQDRGVHRAGFAVLEGVTMPSVLVEVGFLTSPREARDLEARSAREKIAGAMAAAIVRYGEEGRTETGSVRLQSAAEQFPAAPALD